jgi:SAM-dependent methyltransferase
MNHADHVALIKSGVAGRVWADLGSGTGAFTLALADLLGAGADVYSVDHDRHVLAEQERALRERFPATRLHVRVADFTRPLDLPALDGLVMANSLHFVRDKLPLLERLRGYLAAGGRFVLVEYDADRGNAWVPHPLSFESWRALAERAGLVDTRLLHTVPSRFFGRIFAALSLAPGRVGQSVAVGTLDFGPFLRLREDVRVRLSAEARTVHVPAGEPLIREHSASSGAYVLTEGRLRVEDADDGTIIRRLAPPALVGEMGPLLNRPRTASVVAETPATVLFLSIFALREAIADDPEFEEALREGIEARLHGG